MTADYLLVATGRGPVTQGLGVEGLGFNLDRGYVAVDNLFRTGVPGFSAVGDVISFGPAACRIRSSRTCRRPRASSPPSGLRART